MSKRVVLKNVRLSYANVWEPVSVNGGPEKYSASLLIDKSDTQAVAAINAAIEAAITEGEAKLKKNGKMPSRAALKTPLRDGDTDRPDSPEYAGHYFINANANVSHPPQIVDQRLNPITDRSEVYSGVYANVSVEFYAYNTNGNRGVAAGLGNIQKIKDGDVFGSVRRAVDDFDAIDDEGSSVAGDFGDLLG